MLREPYRFDTEQIWQVSRRQIVASGEGYPRRDSGWGVQSYTLRHQF